MDAASERPLAALPENIADRYEVIRALGEGGTAIAYEVRDRSSGHKLALKRLTARHTPSNAVFEFFEREYHTLNQLAHPRVVRAYEYGFDTDGQPFYTMELLDGGDLRSLSPLPSQTVCVIAYEVCSALSLLHSRRLVHRDITPRNIRLTADGKAKLIDFGLLSPFGVSSIVAGTPPHVAPELMNSMALDGRSDLFSLGASLYYALTGRLAFPARRFEQLRDLWRTSPPAPSRLVAGIPEALDQLVMALLRINVSARPKTAAEVMARLRPLLPAPPDEELTVARAYLIAPQLVGRSQALVRLRKQMVRSTRARGGGFLLTGPPGSGRTRLLEAFVLESKLLGAATARVGAGDAVDGDFSAAQKITEQLYRSAPAVARKVAAADPAVAHLLFATATPTEGAAIADLTRPGITHAAAQTGLRAFIQGMAEHQLVAIAVDDLELIDGPSAALVASLSMGVQRRQLAYAITTQSACLESPSQPLAVLVEHGGQLSLEPLSQEHMLELLRGVFGDVPNLQVLAASLYARSGGLPRECLALSQHLVDQELITYDEGRWNLPAEIPASALPRDAQGALAGQVNALSPASRHVGRLLALSVIPHLTRTQLVSVATLNTIEVDRAFDELCEIELASGAGTSIALRHALAKSVLLEPLDQHAMQALHSELAELHRHSKRGVLAVAFHGIQGMNPQAELASLLTRLGSIDDRTAAANCAFEEIGGTLTAEAIAMCCAAAERFAADARTLFPLWALQAGVAASGEAAERFYHVAASWLTTLKHLSGFNDWLALPESENPQERSITAFLRAAERYQATPEAERIASPEEAIKDMVAYVVFAIAIGVRTLDLELLESLKEVLVPFIPLNPLVAAMDGNARASLDYACGRHERARARYIELIAMLDGLQASDLAFLDKIRAAIMMAVADTTIVMGIEPEEKWLPRNDGSQIVSIEYIYKVFALHRGDWEAAEAHRQQAELLALQNRVSSMFSLIVGELEAHFLARDLTGLQALRKRIKAMARTSAGWLGVAQTADAGYDFLRGNMEAALAAVRTLRHAPAERAARDKPPNLPIIEVIEVEALLALGRAEEAYETGTFHLRRLSDDGCQHFARVAAPSVALAAAHLGLQAQALAQLAAVDAEQQCLGVEGLLRGRTAEYRARVAMVSGDAAGFASAADAAAQDYLGVPSSMLAALQERLMEDAAAAGLIAGAVNVNGKSEKQRQELETRLRTTLIKTGDADARAHAALSLLCDGDVQRAGYLFLLTRTGLSLCAANRSRGELDALQRFAQAQLEVELDDDICTLTSELEEGAAAAGDLNLFIDRGGIGYTSVPLICHSEGGLYLVGVALLSAPDAGPDEVHGLAQTVAKYLVDSGDYAPVLAA